MDTHIDVVNARMSGGLGTFQPAVDGLDSSAPLPTGGPTYYPTQGGPSDMHRGASSSDSSNAGFASAPAQPATPARAPRRSLQAGPSFSPNAVGFAPVPARAPRYSSYHAAPAPPAMTARTPSFESDTAGPAPMPNRAPRPSSSAAGQGSNSSRVPSYLLPTKSSLGRSKRQSGDEL